jgi:hypothetical protein
MNRDLELDTWRREWQAETVGSTDLAARVERDTRRMRYFVIIEVVITVVLGGGSIAWSARYHPDGMIALVVGVWTFLAIAWLMSWIVRRGAWAPLASTTAAFLDLSILRCRRRRDTVFVQCALYVAILCFDLWWIRTHSPPHAALALTEFLTSPVLIAVWIVTVLLAAVAVGYYKRLGRELDSLLALQEDFEGRSS